MGTLKRRAGRLILALGSAMLTVPSASLLADFSRQTGQRFELRETLESTDLAAKLQRDLEVVDGAHQPWQNIVLVLAISPCSMCQPRHNAGIVPKIGADAVFVVSRESTDGLLDLEQKPFGILHDGWRHE